MCRALPPTLALGWMVGHDLGGWLLPAGSILKRHAKEWDGPDFWIPRAWRLIPYIVFPYWMAALDLVALCSLTGLGLPLWHPWASFPRFARFVTIWALSLGVPEKICGESCVAQTKCLQFYVYIYIYIERDSWCLWIVLCCIEDWTIWMSRVARSVC